MIVGGEKGWADECVIEGGERGGRTSGASDMCDDGA